MKSLSKICAVALCAVLCLSLASPVFSTENLAPVAENLELSTYRGVSVGGRLSAVDPEGDMLTFEITTQPVKGTIQLASDGRFTYTPAEGKKGRDYFGYKAIDANGNASQEATVIITINKQKTKLTYSDMEGNAAEYAAIVLSEQGVYTGANLGGRYVFEPQASVSRGDYLAMCMHLADTKLLSGVTRTGFADDSEIPAWMKPYVSTALMNQVITGYSDETRGTLFDPARPISYYEAAVLLDNLLSPTDVSVSAMEDSIIPVWAAQASANLAACDIMDGVSVSDPTALTRAEVSLMLLNAMRLVKK